MSLPCQALELFPRGIEEQLHGLTDFELDLEKCYSMQHVEQSFSWQQDSIWKEDMMILQKKLWSSDLCTEVGIRTSDYFLYFISDLLYNIGQVI